VNLVSFEPVQASSQLSDARVIVTGGAGLRTKENYDAYIRPLATEMGGPGGGEHGRGLESAVGTRHDRPRHQVGQTVRR